MTPMRHPARSTSPGSNTRKRVPILTPVATAVVMALGPNAAVLAQDDDDFQLDEVIVTATKREMNLQDIPHNIDVLSGDDLIKMGANDLEATLRALPSVNLTTTMPGRNSLVIRGISTGPFEYRTDALVSVYLDEQPMTSNSQQVGIRNVDMARVEQLAGPQGTLFGSSSQAGTIRYITNKPTTRGLEGNIEAGYGVTSGGDDSYDINGVLNIPLIDETLAVRAVAYHSLEGGYVDNVLGLSLNGNYDNAAIARDDINEYEVSGGRVAALWDVTENWSVLASVIGETNEADGTWESDPALGDYKITRFHEEFRDDEWVSGSLTLNGDLGFATLTVNATTFDRDIVYEFDNMAYSHGKDRELGGGLYREAVYAGNPYAYVYTNYPIYDTNYLQSYIFNDQSQERETFEVRLTSSGDSRLQWMVGAYYEDVFDEWYYGTLLPGFENTRAFTYAQYYAYQSSQTNPDQQYPIPVTDIGYSNTLRRSVQQTAVFGEASFDLTEKLTVIGGIRWAEFDRDSFSRFAFPEGLAPFGDRDASGSFEDVGSDSDTIYKFAVQYAIDDDRMIYGLYSQGFRLGGINSPRAASTGQVPQRYNSDLLNNYEFGIKSSWLDNRLTFNADVFLMEWDDYQQGQSFDLWWLRGVVNAPSARNMGFEMYTDWQVTERLLLSANLFVADPEFTEDWSSTFVDGEQQPPDPDDLTIRQGMPMPNSPKRSAWASIYYDIPNVLGGDAWVYFDYAFGDESWNELDSILDRDRNGLSPSWTYSNFSFGLALQNQWDIELNVNNVFDSAGYNYVADGNNGDAALFGDPRFNNIRTLDRPRTIWLSVRKGFSSN